MVLSNILKTLAKYVFLLYTGYRNWLFMAVVSGQEPVLQILGVVSTEGALIFWDHYTRHSEDGSYPRTIAMLMTGVSLIAVLVGVYAHIEINAYAELNIPVPRYVIDNTIMAIVGIIGLNLCAIIACEHLSDSQLERTKALERGEQVRAEKRGGSVDWRGLATKANQWLSQPIENSANGHKKEPVKVEPPNPTTPPSQIG